MELFEIKELQSRLTESILDLKEHLKIEDKKKRILEIDKEFENPDIWNEPEKSVPLSKEKVKLEKLITSFDKALEFREELEVYFEFYNDDESIENFKELEKTVNKLKNAVEDIEFQKMLSGDHDINNAIISINSGSGGTESQDWAGMLLRMLTMYLDKKELKHEILDLQAGDAGKGSVKSVTFSVKGEYAYGFMKSESGVHRLVRISPFDSSARRHTSFASVAVTPEIDDSIEVEIKPEDIRIDTFRASGAGGQHVNKTDSAIRITHFPTNIVVSCQNERSQHRNKETAFNMLRSKLYELELKKQEQERDKLNSDKLDNSWGSQIRSYVLHPYKMIKDHRTNVETGNTGAVLDGDLEQFVKAYLLKFGKI